MFKKTLLVLALVGTFGIATAQDANAWIIHRRAPVRRAVARVVLPPYPIAHRVVAGPVVHPRAVVYGPTIYAGPGYYVW